MNANDIARNIRKLREARHWSQEELAIASGVDVRTVQRGEASRPLSVDSLRALAAAFDTTVEALQVSEELLAAVVEEFGKKYKIIDMHVLSGSSDLGEMVSGSEAFLLQRIGELAEEQLDQIAEFEQTLRDYLDIWREIPATSRREAEKTLHQQVESLTASNMRISFGAEGMGLRLGNGESLRMAVLYIAVTAGSVPMLALVRQKNVPISFG